ncbi:MAG TPA: Stk1 family PASTA domain-containing Ser/Thr kinase [Candidatus Coprovivens excrementavium]|nr:Stk1 family PASTA domain-containing Ser/Thr kinase [Candidatus Coprovivens excrementavium]
MIMKGQKINDRYQIIKSIGEGGMANVYLAYDTILDRDVAVKVLRGDLSNDEKFVRRFQREALNASSLSHPNIVEVYDVGDDNGQYFIVMEYIEGKNLKDLLKKRGKLTTSEVVDIMSQIADGLSVAHDSYIIHRDIKPQNIMILENGLVKITDFGIAMAMNATQLTQTNSVMGSVHYLPPEQASGKGSTLKSDIYSMGILMYELLTGKLPYRGDNAVEIALKHLKEPLPSIRDELPDLPQSVENIILKSAAKNPKNRYNDAREMYEDLKTCLDESRINEPRYEYQYPELDSDNKKFTKQVEKAISVEEDDGDNDQVEVKKVSDSELKKENKILVILAAIFVGLVVIVAAFVLFLPSILRQDDITVPEVAGKTVSEVVNELQDLGFEVADETVDISDDKVEEGKVVKTNPPSGAKRTEGTVVTIYVSTGDSKYEIEDYTGKNYLEVKGALEAYNILVYVEKKDVKNPEDYDEGEIIDQDVKAGEKLGARDSITLYIPNVDAKYPDFTDGSYTVEDVQQFCDKHNITLEIVNEENSSYDEGTIFKQSRPEGYTVTSGTKLIIYVASAPSENEEPADDDCGGLC